MKSLFQFSLASTLLTFLFATSCSKESFDISDPVDLPAVVDTVFVEDPIAYTIQGTSQSSVSSGTAHYGTNGDRTAFVLTSDNVDVECPGGMATSFQGGEEGEDYFQFHFFETNGIQFVSYATFNNALVDGNRRWVSWLTVPDCIGDRPVIEYEIDGDRITGTVTAEFFYPNPVYVDPFENCDNWISIGVVDVSFDLPLVKCFER
ncbi:MAG: hypothetical protein AB8F78_01765 [Saprospiraceae bacterium]